MSSGYDVHAMLRDILKSLRKDIEGLTAADLRQLADNVLARRGELRFPDVSAQIIEGLLANEKPSRKKRVVVVEISVEGEQIITHFARSEMEEIMWAYDRNRLSVAHCIVAEMMREKRPARPSEDHPAIHLFPKCSDEVLFVNNYSSELLIEFHADRDRKLPLKIHESPFDLERLTCRGNESISTGPARVREGQRFFKYSISGDHLITLDPHMIDHNDESDPGLGFAG